MIRRRGRSRRSPAFGSQRTACGVLLMALAGCMVSSTSVARSAPGAEHRDSAATKAPPALAPARIFPLPELMSEAMSAVTEPDGTRRLLIFGMRLLDHPDGSLERSDSLLPPGRALKSLELPERFGGGFLFAIDTNSGTRLYKARSWLGDLEGVAELDFEVDRMEPGFDRLYLFDRRAGELHAIDVSNGRMLETGPLPSSPTFGSMLFPTAWFGAVQVPFRGALVSFDAGESWSPLADSSARLSVVREGEIAVATQDGAFALSEDGSRKQVVIPEAQEASDDARVDSALHSPEGGEDKSKQTALMAPASDGRPLRSAVLRGVRDTSQSALVVLESGALVRVRLSDGKPLFIREGASSSPGVCQGLAVEGGIGFVCGQEHGPTVVYRVTPALKLIPVLRFPGPRFVTANSAGALVIRGSCSALSAPAGTYCLRSPAGRSSEIRVRERSGTERVIALSDQRVAVIVPPQGQAGGSLRIFQSNGTSRRVALQLPNVEKKRRWLLESGLWLDGFFESDSGELSGWVVGGTSFAGVRIALDGNVVVSSPEHDVSRALLSGRFGVVFPAPGLFAESVDGGFTWREAELPSDEETARSFEPSGEEQGCSALGCAFGHWLRVGWRSGAEPQDEAFPSLPTVRRINPGGSRWSLQCRPMVASSAHARAAPSADEDDDDEQSGSARTRVRRASFLDRPPESSPWRAFYDLAPPAKPAGDVGFSAGTEQKPVELTGYAWGPRGDAWSGRAQWQLAAADPFSARGAWRTLASKAPWPDAVLAAQSFGADPGTSSNWEAALDPDGSAGALVIASRGTTELFLFEKDRPIVQVRDAARFGFLSLSGVVKLKDSWFLSAEGGAQDFRLFKVVGDRLVLVGEYPLFRSARLPFRASVVRTTRGDALGIWARSTGWYVFPLDDRAKAGPPLELTPSTLARVPHACTTHEDGWLLKTLPSEIGRDLLEPNLDTPEPMRSVEVKLVANAWDLCVDGMAAQVDAVSSIHGPHSAPIRAPKKNPISLIVTDRQTRVHRRYQCSG